jgi:hypothetical protein
MRQSFSAAEEGFSSESFCSVSFRLRVEFVDRAWIKHAGGEMFRCVAGGSEMRYFGITTTSSAGAAAAARRNLVPWTRRSEGTGSPEFRACRALHSTFTHLMHPLKTFLASIATLSSRAARQ